MDSVKDKERETQCEDLKANLNAIYNDRKENHPKGKIEIMHIPVHLFEEMAYCFLAKHSK